MHEPTADDGSQSTRRTIAGESPYEPFIGFSRGVRDGRHVAISGTGPVGADDADVATQTERCLTIVAETIGRAGGSLAHVIRTRIFLTHREDWEAVGSVHAKFFGDVRPAATMIVIAGMLDPRWRVEIEADAILPA